jgi:hypothetical protein
MDIALLTKFIAPFLPALINLGEKASEKMAEELGENAWNKAKAIWTKLQLQVAAKPDLMLAIEQVAAKPDSEPRQAVLQEELEILLNENTDLARAIAQILQSDNSNRPPRTQIIQTVTGNQNQMIGQVSGGQIFGKVTGPIVISGPVSQSAAIPVAVVDPMPPDAPLKTILVLTANPNGTNPLRLGEEVRKIQTGLERSHYRDRFQLEQRWAVTSADMRRVLLDCHPQVVHFSGHGVGFEMPSGEALSTRKLGAVCDTEAEPEGLVFEDEAGQQKLVSGEAIANLFALFADQVECVVLNACYSATQAEAIAQNIPYVVGMKRAIGDRAAIEFAIGFYDALLAGKTVEFAYKLGCNAIQMAGIPEHLTPVLKQKQK